MPSRLLQLVLSLIIISGCASQQLKPYVENYADYQERIYVIDHGIHTALVVEANDFVEKIGLEDTFYNNFRFIEIGRGDSDFYQDKEERLSTALKALFVSTPAVLHMLAYNSPPDKRYLLSHTIQIRLSTEALKKLIASLVASFEIQQGKAIETGDATSQYGRLFKAKGNYHLFYTCNNWTADILQQAGYPISYSTAFFAGSVMSQIEAVQRRLGVDSW